MKQMNFPSRKHQRRVEALSRLKIYAGEFPTKNQTQAVHELELLIEKPVTTHTKKNRSYRANLRRL